MNARGTDFIRATAPDDTAAELVADALERIAAETGRVRFAVTGGSAAAAVARCLERLAARDFDFDRLLLTWIDERCVPLASPESNAGALALPRPPRAVLRLFEDGESPAEAVERVSRELRTTFDGALDCVLLGMGPDGHVASLFPGRPDPPGLAAHVADSPKPPPDRITLTRRTLDTSRTTLLVACGEGKRNALERLYAADPHLPATGLADVVVTDLWIGDSR